MCLIQIKACSALKFYAQAEISLYLRRAIMHEIDDKTAMRRLGLVILVMVGIALALPIAISIAV